MGTAPIAQFVLALVQLMVVGVVVAASVLAAPLIVLSTFRSRGLAPPTDSGVLPITTVSNTRSLATVVTSTLGSVLLFAIAPTNVPGG